MRVRPRADLRSGLTAGGLALLLAAASASQAAMQLSRTRLVLHEAEGQTAIELRSADRAPLLLQMWVEADGQTDHAGANRAEEGVAGSAGSAGAAESAGSTARHPARPATPFITDPPVLRLEPGQSRAVQLWLTEPPADAPSERESLYWFNVLEVPAQAPAEHRLHMAVQSRLKLFYRPRALADYDRAALPAAEQLRVHLEREASAEVQANTQTDTPQAWLRIENPAPLYQSLATLSVQVGERAPLALDAPMVPPFGQVRLALPAALAARAAAAAPVQVQLAILNDDGNPIVTLIDNVQAL